MFTLEDVFEVLNRIDTNRTNPEPGCVYTGPNGDHCIAGQVCVELRVDIPEWNPEVGDSSITLDGYDNPNTQSFDASKMADFFDDEATIFLSKCQLFADEGSVRWDDAISEAMVILEHE